MDQIISVKTVIYGMRELYPYKVASLESVQFYDLLARVIAATSIEPRPVTVFHRPLL